MVQTKGRAAEVFPGITMDPEVRFGKPCITGTRIDVATVIGAIAAGESVEAVEQSYELTKKQSRPRFNTLPTSPTTLRRRSKTNLEGPPRRELPPPALSGA